MFEMLTGQLPFEAETLPALALKHLHEPPPLISTLNPTVPTQLEQIINKVLSKEPAGRYRTAGQLERILRSYDESAQQDTGPIAPVRASSQSMQPLTRPVVAEGVTEVFERTPVARERRAELEEMMSQPPAESAYALADQNTPYPTRRARGFEGASTVQSYGDGQLVGTDWTAITLGLVAVIAMLGLIPLWYFVARAWGVW